MKKLLIVDDETDICDFLKGFFSARGFDVWTANNGREALSVFDSEKPNIVLLDIGMPVMNGLEALREIRKKDISSKVVMVTKVGDPLKVEEAMAAGATVYMTKPVSLEELEKTVLSLSGGAHMAKTA